MPDREDVSMIDAWSASQAFGPHSVNSLIFSPALLATSKIGIL